MAGSALLYGVWVRTTGNRPGAGRPSRAGRMTSARRTTPSDIVIGTSRSMTVPYVAGRAVHWPVDPATVRGGPAAAGYARDVDRVGATMPACVGAVEVKACARPSASCGVACTANDAGAHASVPAATTAARTRAERGFRETRRLLRSEEPDRATTRQRARRLCGSASRSGPDGPGRQRGRPPPDPRRRDEAPTPGPSPTQK